MSEVVTIMTACGAAENAEAIARALVAEKLAACVQMLDVKSVYFWNDETHADPEILLLIKTRAVLQDAVCARIQALHAYDLPEIIALPVTFGSQGYLDWVAAQTK
ncbi:MAG: divalent cation tolerance protein CutA [Alphaproteobacteria bacterium]|nr:divalent cation tolerance protein CutA [Alphaproteobacteria bacterium]